MCSHLLTLRRDQPRGRSLQPFRPAREYRGDLQMHSEWSDGSPTVDEIAGACVERGYHFAAVTDHSYGLSIAGGMSMAEARAQRLAVDAVNVRCQGRFRLLQGVEANIDAEGGLDLADDEAAMFDVVLAAPHSRLRKSEDQTRRLLTVLRHPAVRILAPLERLLAWLRAPSSASRR